MMPLMLAKTGDKTRILRIGGKDESRRHLQNLGFVEGDDIEVVSELNGNLIISVKDVRVAISKEMANRIMVEPA